MTFGRVLATEVIKLRRSRITWLSWLAASVLPLACGLFMWIVKEPGRASRLGLLGKKAQLVSLTPDWPSYFDLLLQGTGIAGVILASVIAVYVFGREYSDATTKTLLTLPLGRHWFALGKLALVLLWFGALTLSSIVESFAVGWLLSLPGFSWELALASGRNVLTVALVTWLLVPAVAWITALGRGYLAPMGFTFFMLLMGNVLGATGWGKWFPWSIVPLFAGVAGPRSDTLAAESLTILALAAAAGTAGMIWQLRFADNSE
jgi:ABC-2 type transport system permease protein